MKVNPRKTPGYLALMVQLGQRSAPAVTLESVCEAHLNRLTAYVDNVTPPHILEWRWMMLARPPEPIQFGIDWTEPGPPVTTFTPQEKRRKKVKPTVTSQPPAKQAEPITTNSIPGKQGKKRNSRRNRHTNRSNKKSNR